MAEKDYQQKKHKPKVDPLSSMGNKAARKMMEMLDDDFSPKKNKKQKK